MTREEAIEVIKDIYNYTKWDTYTTNEARTMAIKALEQQPCEDVISRDCDKCAYYVDGANDEACDGCFADEYEHPNFKPKAQHYEDCISRQAVDELSKELVHTTRDKADFLCNFWEGLQKLPPVTPKEKTGHCKECKYFEYDSMAKVNGIPLIVAHEICSRWGDGCKTKEDGYCFLFEPQESEKI